MAKKTTKKAATKKKTVKPRKQTSAKPTKRALAVGARMAQFDPSGSTREAMLSLILEIDRVVGSKEKLALGEISARWQAANFAFEEAVLSSAIPADWVAAARKAAGLP